jgi:hypothetical protein
VLSSMAGFLRTIYHSQGRSLVLGGIAACPQTIQFVPIALSSEMTSESPFQIVPLIQLCRFLSESSGVIRTTQVIQEQRETPLLICRRKEK